MLSAASPALMSQNMNSAFATLTVVEDGIISAELIKTHLKSFISDAFKNLLCNMKLINN